MLLVKKIYHLTIYYQGSLKSKVSEVSKKHGSFPTYNYPTLGLIVNIDRNDLSNTCKEIVAEFDVKYIE